MAPNIWKLVALLVVISAVSYLSISNTLSDIAAKQRHSESSFQTPESFEPETSSPDRQKKQHEGTSSSGRNTSLVIVMGELRGGEDTWKTLYENVLDVNSADLAVFTTNNVTYHRNNSLLLRAKYVWRHDEYADWADAIDTIDGNLWRKTHLPKFHDYNVYSYRGRNRSILFGGIAGHACDPITAGTSWCTHDGSGVVVFMLRHWLRERIREEVLGMYETFVVTRPDNMYLCPHDFGELELGNDRIWVPSGEEYGGYCDRHLVASADSVLEALDVMRELTNRPYAWDYDKHHNTERFLKHAWLTKGLNVSQFPRVMFTVKTRGDATRWQKGEEELPGHPGLLVKYRREWYGAQDGCGRYWREHLSAEDKLRQRLEAEESLRRYREGTLTG